MSKLLSRSALLSVKLPYRDVTVPELGQDVAVRVQQMSVNTRAAYLERIRVNQADRLAYEEDQLLPVEDRQNGAQPADLDVGLLALVHSLVDEDGKPMFAEADMSLFNEWPHNAVTRIYEQVLDINYYNQSPIAAKEAEKKG
ncbi:hypothetical protein KCP91_12100 [Microvirga sp. SRT01]|uniref:Tail assembly chaperone n=1 Tax=Sphingomonas longa TaxID=2778730 RepID=A0ABS2D872_9SPHN|nr:MULTISPECIES: hypothetical protein [Alphaproteobacteria]MBM6577115.1 hypothetical protein [Sphingomonas sp. BT552]MBR7710159.1 hypothetical protein [Microvirga sp. SRT01]